MATVLYVEHNWDNVLLVKRLLEARGHELVWAADGSTGLRLSEACYPDLILLDIELPDMDGHDVARHIRADAGHRLFNVPVIAITSNTRRGAALNALAAGCDVYMPKPIDIHQLWELVGHYCPAN